jgi:hypothetical protein
MTTDQKEGRKEECRHQHFDTLPGTRSSVFHMAALSESPSESENRVNLVCTV